MESGAAESVIGGWGWRESGGAGGGYGGDDERDGGGDVDGGVPPVRAR